MKTLLVIIDGLGDDKIADFGNKTVYEYAKHPNLDRIATNGFCSSLSIAQKDFLPESLACTLRILGLEQKEFPTNRAYMELLANGKDISEFEMVLRCNLVSIDQQGCLHSFNGEGLSKNEINEITNIANEYRSNIEFIHLSDYRNLLILDKKEDVLREAMIKPPHESIGENIVELLNDLREKSLVIADFIDATEKRLAKFARKEFTYLFYPWGPAEREQLKSFEERYQRTGAVVCKAEIIRGIALALGLTIMDLKQATGETDTNLLEKAQQTISALQSHDFVFTHFNGTDEAAHRYDYREKAAFVERIDREFFAFLLNNWHEPVKILVCADHATSSLSGKHTRDKVPCIAATLNYKEKITVFKDYHDIKNFLFARR